jgi:hypothetical protein
MADISKASRVVERDLRFREEDPTVKAEKQQIIDQLRHGNIHEIFARQTKFKISDFTDFFSNQWRNFRSQIIQDAEIKASEAGFHTPDLSDFPVHHQGTNVTPEEGELFSQAMGEFLTSGTGGGAGAGKWKAQGVAGEGEVPEAGAMMPDELVSMTQGTIGEWDQFLDDTWGTIFDAQLTQEMQRKMGEIKSEVQRIIALAKEGKIGVEFVLIALAKVNATKNGVLMSGLGKKMYHINENMNRMSEELYQMSASGDPNYYAQVQMTQSETRDGSFQLNLLVQDMQKVMQDVAGTMEFVHSTLGELNRSRREIITHMSAR